MGIEPIFIQADAFVSRFHVRPERREAFLDIFNALWKADIPGLQAVTNFVFYGWGRDPNEFVAIESWKDQAAMDEVRKSPFFQEQVTRLLDCCDRPMEMQLFSGMEGGRAVFDQFPAGASKVHPRAGEIGAVFL
jgi:quinol monooxygenase YgiN